MSCLGVLFSLDKETVLKLKSYESDQERLDFLQEEIEADIMTNQPEMFAELVHSWDALHRSLTDGKLEWTNGNYPLNQVVLGGERIYHQDNYIMSLKTPEDVQRIAETISTISHQELEKGYSRIAAEDYGMDTTIEDFEDTWIWFQESLEFWKKAAAERRFVLFTADQ